MKSIKACQATVTRIESAITKGVPSDKREVIRTLGEYVNSADRKGVESSPLMITKALLDVGWRDLDDMTDADKKDLSACIVGNFITSGGRPPPNVMDRFCCQYLAQEEAAQ